LGRPGITRRPALAIFDLMDGLLAEVFAVLDWYFFFEAAGVLGSGGACAPAASAANITHIAHEYWIRIIVV
jgi:hypothetical protein